MLWRIVLSGHFVAYYFEWACCGVLFEWACCGVLFEWAYCGVLFDVTVLNSFGSLYRLSRYSDWPRVRWFRGRDIPDRPPRPTKPFVQWKPGLSVVYCGLSVVLIAITFCCRVVCVCAGRGVNLSLAVYFIQDERKFSVHLCCKWGSRIIRHFRCHT